MPTEKNPTSATHKTNTDDNVSIVDDKVAKEKNLSGDVINVIGQRLLSERVLAPPVHSSFVIRWSEILKLGLPAAEKVELIKKYPPPENCTFLDPPKLNPEVHYVITDVARTRDKRIMDKHAKNVACMAGISKIITNLLENEKPEDVPTI